MITDQERIIRKSQGYDIGFEQNGKKYWINSNEWNEKKEEKLSQETGLKSFREQPGNRLVLYNPSYFEVCEMINCTYLHYIGEEEQDIPQPVNMSSCYEMFLDCELSRLDLSNWDVSNVVNMVEMFGHCANLKYLNLCNWNLKSSVNAYYAFAGCFEFLRIYRGLNSPEILQKIIEDSNEHLETLQAF